MNVSYIARIALFAFAAIQVQSAYAQRNPVLLREAKANFVVPQSVIEAIKAAPMSFGESISQTKVYRTPIIRTQNLTIATNSKLTFELDMSKPPPPFIAIAAYNVYLQRPATSADSTRFTYSVSGTLNGTSPGTSPSGWDANGGYGLRGGDGQPGLQGGAGRTYQLPPVYILFQNLSVQGGNPTSSSLLSINFDGVPGGDGSIGGSGGRGGTGSRGSDAECNEICLPIVGCNGFECRAGPGRGGDGGTPGLGGVGGSGATGGNGADIHFVGPSAAISLMGFFSTSNREGAPGAGGPGGFCGASGQKGGGGSRKCCPRDAGHGNDTSCPGPSQAKWGPSGNSPGNPGIFSTTVRDLSDLF